MVPNQTVYEEGLKEGLFGKRLYELGLQNGLYPGGKVEGFREVVTQTLPVAPGDPSTLYQAWPQTANSVWVGFLSYYNANAAAGEEGLLTVVANGVSRVIDTQVQTIPQVFDYVVGDVAGEQTFQAPVFFQGWGVSLVGRGAQVPGNQGQVLQMMAVSRLSGGTLSPLDVGLSGGSGPIASGDVFMSLDIVMSGFQFFRFMASDSTGVLSPKQLALETVASFGQTNGVNFSAATIAGYNGWFVQVGFTGSGPWTRVTFDSSWSVGLNSDGALPFDGKYGQFTTSDDGANWSAPVAAIGMYNPSAYGLDVVKGPGVAGNNLRMGSAGGVGFGAVAVQSTPDGAVFSLYGSALGAALFWNLVGTPLSANSPFSLPVTPVSGTAYGVSVPWDIVQPGGEVAVSFSEAVNVQTGANSLWTQSIAP